MVDPEKSCCFSGHRNISDDTLCRLHEELLKTIIDLYNEGYKCFIAGGAIGFDMLAAITVLNLKVYYPDIRLILALPCPDHTRLWSEEDKSLFRRVFERADEKLFISPNYTPSCMSIRNKYMVNHSKVCICYMNRQRSGTGNTVRYAKNANKRIINLYE